MIAPHARRQHAWIRGVIIDRAGQADLHEIDHVGADGLLGGGGGQRGLETNSQVPAWRIREVVARWGVKKVVPSTRTLARLAKASGTRRHISFAPSGAAAK
jgi:hypothetical protein